MQMNLARVSVFGVLTVFTGLAGCASETDDKAPATDEGVTSVQEASTVQTSALSVSKSCGPFLAERAAFEIAYGTTQGRSCKVVDPSKLTLQPPLDPSLTYRCCSVSDGDTKTLCGGSIAGLSPGSDGYVFDCAAGNSVYSNDASNTRYVRFYDGKGKLVKRQQQLTGVDRWSLEPGGKGQPYINVFGDYLETLVPDAPGSENLSDNFKGAEAIAFSQAGRLVFADYGQITYPADGGAPTVQCGQWPAALEFDTKVGPAVCKALGTTY